MNNPRKNQHAESQPGNNLSPTELATAVRGFLIGDFPDIDVQVQLDPEHAAPPFNEFVTSERYLLMGRPVETRIQPGFNAGQ
jgi:hypothetical protein